MTTSDIIAIAAAAIAFITFVASLWQARITRIHNRLSVRPAIEIFCAKNPSAGYLIRIENHGLGPARIKSIILDFNGVKYEICNIQGMLSFLKATFQNNLSAIEYTIPIDCHIAPGQQLEILSVKPEKSQLTEEQENVLARLHSELSISLRYQCMYDCEFSTYWQGLEMHGNGHINSKEKKLTSGFLFNFLILAFMSFILFFLSIGLGKPCADLISYMNDGKTAKPTHEWIIFGIGAPIATAIWCCIYLILKTYEKKCVDLLLK